MVVSLELAATCHLWDLPNKLTIHLCFFLFLVTLCFVVAVQPCVDWIPVVTPVKEGAWFSKWALHEIIKVSFHLIAVIFSNLWALHDCLQLLDEIWGNARVSGIPDNLVIRDYAKAKMAWEILFAKPRKEHRNLNS